MNEMFSQGGKGSTGILTNKQAVARHFGVKQNEVVYFAVGVDLGEYKVIYDKTTQRAYSLPVLPVGTTAVSLNEQAILVHSAGTVDLGELGKSRGSILPYLARSPPVP
ncbi:tail spike protein [Escherichia phage U1G]|uniref:Tailspike protein n=1 Tax=Escherichia phage U1G TaxID=2853091 RepID=A0AAE7VIP0_9CAUD|nr:tail spike protein [Escherichia phage U1G]QXV71913.1 tailspike protein [Escherichia phage U1G]